jgi:hypothetical protein
MMFAAMSPSAAQVLVAALATAPTALELYRAGKLDEACPAFQKMAEEKRNDGAAWADLGLCELKRGHLSEGRAATARALHYGNKKVRAGAAFNWSRYVKDEPATEGCAWAEPEPGLECAKRYWACADRESNMGIGRDPANWYTVQLLALGVDEKLMADAGVSLPKETMKLLDGALPKNGDRLLRVALTRIVWENPKGGAGEESRHECTLVLFDPCGFRAWISCADDGKATGYVREIGAGDEP